MNETKICTFCGIEKALVDFPYRSLLSHEHREYCFKCNRLVQRVQAAAKRAGLAVPTRKQLRHELIFGEKYKKAAKYGQPFHYPAFDDFLSDLDKFDDALDEWCEGNGLKKFGRVPRQHYQVLIRPEALREV